MALKRKDIKFCPACASTVVPWQRGMGAVATCTGCGLEFTAFSKPFQPTQPVFGGHKYRDECGRKLRHATVVEAFARCLVLEDIPHRYRDTMQFYRCRWCEKIHMGHGGKKQQKNATVSYTHEAAQRLYEEAIQNGELIGYSEINQK